MRTSDEILAREPKPPWNRNSEQYPVITAFASKHWFRACQFSVPGRHHGAPYPPAAHSLTTLPLMWHSTDFLLATRNVQAFSVLYCKRRPPNPALLNLLARLDASCGGQDYDSVDDPYAGGYDLCGTRQLIGHAVIGETAWRRFVVVGAWFQGACNFVLVCVCVCVCTSACACTSIASTARTGRPKKRTSVRRTSGQLKKRAERPGGPSGGRDPSEGQIGGFRIVLSLHV